VYLARGAVHFARRGVAHKGASARRRVAAWFTKTHAFAGPALRGRGSASRPASRIPVCGHDCPASRLDPRREGEDPWRGRSDPGAREKIGGVPGRIMRGASDRIADAMQRSLACDKRSVASAVGSMLALPARRGCGARRRRAGAASCSARCPARPWRRRADCPRIGARARAPRKNSIGLFSLTSSARIQRLSSAS
jgi:hypothetical protein